MTQPTQNSIDIAAALAMREQALRAEQRSQIEGDALLLKALQNFFDPTEEDQAQAVKAKEDYLAGA